MRTKALVLACRPPYVGPWVPIGERERWACVVESRPPVELNGAVEIEVVSLDGSVEKFPPNGDVTGVRARALVGVVEERPSVTVTLEEPEDE